MKINTNYKLLCVVNEPEFLMPHTPKIARFVWGVRLDE